MLLDVSRYVINYRQEICRHRLAYLAASLEPAGLTVKL